MGTDPLQAAYSELVAVYVNRQEALARVAAYGGMASMKEYRDHERGGTIIENGEVVCFVPDNGGNSVYYSRKEWDEMRTGSKAKTIGAILGKHTVHAVSVSKRTGEKREGDPDVYEVQWSDVGPAARKGRPETMLAEDLLEELTGRLDVKRLRGFFPRDAGYAEVWTW